MATVIDALIVMLGLDSKDLESKTPAAVKNLDQIEKKGDKAEKSLGKISKTSKETASNVQNLSRTVTSFLAIIGGTVAVKMFIQDFIEANAQLDRLSKNLGISVSTISAWGNASEKLGGSAQGLQGTFDMLSKAQTQLMLTGESSLIPYMSALGVSLAGVDGKARPVNDILLDLSERFSHMDRTTANNLGRMLGIDQGTMNLLLQGRKELELEISRQKEQTAVTAAQTAQAQKFQTQIVGIKQRFEALGRSLLMEAAPSIEKVLTMLEGFATWAQEHQQFISDFLKTMAVGLAAIGLASLPIDLTVVAVLALAAGFALLWDDYQTWAKGGKSEFDWTAFSNGIKTAAEWMEHLANWMKEAYGWFEKLMGSGRGKDKDWIGIPQAKNKGTTSDPVTHQRIPIKSTGLGSNVSAVDVQKFFIAQGWSPAQAAGIAANIMGESSGNSKAVGDNGTAFGLAQWHKDRQADYHALTGGNLKDATTEQQLAFIQHELTKGNYKGAGDALRGTGSAYDAGAIVSRLYERPGNADLRANQRGSYAASMAGIPGAAQIVQNAPAGPAGSSGSVDRSVKTDIGTVVVNTQATDAAGMVSDMDRAFDYLFVSQANYGMVP